MVGHSPIFSGVMTPFFLLRRRLEGRAATVRSQRRSALSARSAPQRRGPWLNHENGSKPIREAPRKRMRNVARDDRPDASNVNLQLSL